MMRLRRASTIFALGLLASATTADAECAWVMWEQWFAPSSVVPLSFARTGTSSEAACRSELRKAIAGIEAEALNPGEERRVDGDAVLFAANEGGSRVVTGIRNFLCLPDTVDPRGAKGR